MARKPRIEYPGAIYHLMDRGDRREPIFMDNEYAQRLVETLGGFCQDRVGVFWRIVSARDDVLRTTAFMACT